MTPRTRTAHRGKVKREPCEELATLRNQIDALVLGFREQDFMVVAHAAKLFWDRGDKESAIVLDELARRINRAITVASECKFGPRTKPNGYDLVVESPLEAQGLR